jgi:protein-S-isoprenylcysteine O-methyltransferase Ste14
MLRGMNLRGSSLFAFGLMVAGLGWLIQRQEALARSRPALAVQVVAVVLMIAARLAFGSRSFHAGANPTAGGLVEKGPYAVLRHPIYAAILYFVWATALDHRSGAALAAASLVTIGAAARMYAEEQLLTAKYPGYTAYRARTARVIPFLF